MGATSVWVNSGKASFVSALDNQDSLARRGRVNRSNAMNRKEVRNEENIETWGFIRGR